MANAAVRRWRTTCVAAAAAAAVLGGGAPAGAASSVAVTSTSVSGAVVTASGTAVLPDPTGPQDIGGSITGFANDQVGTPLGLSLRGAQIERLADGVRFIWRLAELPDEVPPEGIRYTWSFRVGDQTFQLQAKRTNLASITTTEDPQGHALQAASGGAWFQLRGACQTSYRGLPTSGCFHLAFLQGRFDTAANTVSVDLPFETRDSIGRLVAEDFVRGAVLQANETAGASVTAQGQAVVSTTAMGSFLNAWDPYWAGASVSLGVGRPGLDPAGVPYAAAAELAPDGTWTGSVPGASATNTVLYVRGCNGALASCTYTSMPLA